MTVDATQRERPEGEEQRETTVEVRCTGHVREAVGGGRMQYTFEGTTLREFLAAFFEDYDVRDLVLAETEADATTRGWAKPPGELRGFLGANPPGERTRTYARVTVNGKFNEALEGFDTVLEDGDRVALLYPFIFCC